MGIVGVAAIKVSLVESITEMSMFNQMKMQNRFKLISESLHFIVNKTKNFY
jgi:hypothetical protein